MKLTPINEHKVPRKNEIRAITNEVHALSFVQIVKLIHVMHVLSPLEGTRTMNMLNIKGAFIFIAEGDGT